MLNAFKLTFSVAGTGYTSGYGSGGYSSTGYDSVGYESSGRERVKKSMPIDMACKILDVTQGFDLLAMLISEVNNSYDKLGNRGDMFHLHFVKKLSARL
jgi:hypothetical protein